MSRRFMADVFADLPDGIDFVDVKIRTSQSGRAMGNGH